MAIYRASIKRALDPEQKDLIKHKEHCSADPKSSRRPGGPSGIRFGSSATTISTGSARLARCARKPGKNRRMGKGGRERLGAATSLKVR